MNFILLLFMFVFSTFAAATAVFDWTEDGVLLGRRLRWCAFGVFAVLGLWLIGTLTRPKKVEFERTLAVQDMDTPGLAGPVGKTQYVVYMDTDGKQAVLNVNRRFGCRVQPGVKVKMTRYRTGPYCGVGYAWVANTGMEDSFALVE